jgi:hypothetical protein
MGANWGCQQLSDPSVVAKIITNVHDAKKK